MVRVARYDILYEGCYAHIISRSIRKIKIFFDREDFLKFKDLLLIAKRKGKFKIYHYCIMQTHFHLAVEMGDVKEFAYCMRDLKRTYCFWFHAKYKLSGPIWRERYRSLLIENENYLFACGKYIEENPVKAGLVKNVNDWKYSSAEHYSRGLIDELVDVYDNEVREIDEGELDQDDFESGSVIGSSFFRFQFFESRKRSGPVP